MFAILPTVTTLKKRVEPLRVLPVQFEPIHCHDEPEMVLDCVPDALVPV